MNNQNEQNQFKEAFSQLKAPEELKKDILIKMQEENIALQNNSISEIRKPQKISTKNILMTTSGLVGLAAAAFLFVIFSSKQATYITPIEAGEFYDSIELKDGEIQFISDRTVISITPNAGLAGDSNHAEETNDEEAKEDGTIKLRQVDSNLLDTVKEEDLSYIGKQEIYVSVLKTEGYRFQAIYEKDGNTYEVIGTNVSQKEFIDYLYQKIKK